MWTLVHFSNNAETQFESNFVKREMRFEIGTGDVARGQCKAVAVCVERKSERDDNCF